MPAARMLSLIGAITLCCGVSLAAGPPVVSKSRGFMPPAPGTSFTGKRRALIIGIDYKADADARKAKIEALDGAVADATAIRDVLVKHFGYAPGDVCLLTEEKATAAAIEEQLKRLGDATKVTPDDSVLFFFAGHGLRRAGGTGKGYYGELIPFGARHDEGARRPAYEAVIRLHDVKRWLDECNARHKLLILDCCHGGELFNLDLPLQTDRGNPLAELDRKKQQRCFWGASSCGARQSANDKKPGSVNSPYTACLLRMLQDLSGSDGKTVFSAKALFQGVERAFETEGRTTQRPMSGPLDRHTGMFLFCPEGTGWKTRAPQLVARTLPGAQGDWWFDEMPWLMPCIRAQIVAGIKERSMSLTGLEKRKLEAQARLLARDDGGTLGTLHKKHLIALLQLAGQKDKARKLREIADDLIKLEKPLPEDLHLRALIEYQLEKTGEKRSEESESKDNRVVEFFETAIKAYAARKGGNDAMHALCLADCGECRLGLHDYDGAVQDFRRARGIFSITDIPRHFEIYVFCQEATAYRSVGNWDAADRHLQRALTTASREEPNGALAALVAENRAWTAMRSWRIKDASAQFEMAQTIRQALLKVDRRDHDSRLLIFHNLHGLAMVERFRGNAARAARLYLELTRNIREAIKDFQNDSNSMADLRNYRNFRTRLHDRLRNSLERLADCLLFGPEPDPAEAKRFYSKARTACKQVLGEEREANLLTLRYKSVICASLCSSAEDAARARRLLQLASQEWAQLKPKQQRSLSLTREIAEGLVELRCAVPPMADPTKGPHATTATTAKVCPRDKLAQSIDKRLDDHKDALSLQRDDVELLLLGARALLADARSTPPGREKAGVSVNKSLALIRRLCQAVQRHSRAQTLAYLRPVYDLMFLTHLATSPSDVKPLLDLVALAKTGSELDDIITTPTVSFYFTADRQGYALLDIPGKPGKVFVVNDDFDHARNSKRPLSLPPALLAQLRDHRSVAAYWNDDLHHLDHTSAFLFAPSGKDRPEVNLAHADPRPAPTDPRRAPLTVARPGKGAD